jgi:hypothetical protein
MGLLSKLIGRPDTNVAAATPEAESQTCPHLALVPRWDNVDDIGHEDLATSFHCEACGRDFSAGEVRGLRMSEGARLRGGVPPEARN